MEEQKKAEKSSFLLARKTLKRVVEDPRLPHTAIALWATLLSFSNNTTGKCNPSHRRLMKDTQIKSKATLLKYLKLLKDTGYILIDSGRKEKKSNDYLVKLLDDHEALEGAEGFIHCTLKDENPSPRVQTMTSEGVNGCTSRVQSMNTELDSSNYTHSNSAKRPAPTPTKTVVPQQGREVRVDFEDPKAEELRKNPTFLEKLKALSYHLGSNVQGYEPLAMRKAKDMLVSYGHLFTDRPLHTTEVTDFLEAFYASRKWKAPVFEEVRELVDNLVSTMSYSRFKVACDHLESTYQPHWQIPPNFQAFVKAAKEGQGDEVLKLMLALRNNIAICETRGYPSRATAMAYS